KSKTVEQDKIAIDVSKDENNFIMAVSSSLTKRSSEKEDKTL
ncbi:MAG: hypothetical protein ACI90V_007854, partial [Bacillariaceae sp.]